MESDEYFSSFDIESHKRFLEYVYEKYTEHIKVLESKHIATLILGGYQNNTMEWAKEQRIKQHIGEAEEILPYIDCLPTILEVSYMRNTMQRMYRKYRYLVVVFAERGITLKTLEEIYGYNRMPPEFKLRGHRSW